MLSCMRTESIDLRWDDLAYFPFNQSPLAANLNIVENKKSMFCR